MNNIRYFIGIPLNRAVRNQINDFAEKKKMQWAFAKWTHPQDYHITLAFLGDLDMKQAEIVRQTLSTASLACRPFELETDQWGSFGLSQKPSILWAGVKRSTELDRLHKEVWKTIAPLGFEPERRPFRPHITVARRSKGTTAQEIVEEQNYPKLSWQANHAVLFQTHFGRRPAYETVLIIPFQE